MPTKALLNLTLLCILVLIKVSGQRYMKAANSKCFDVTCPTNTEFCRKSIIFVNETTTKTSIECFGLDLKTTQEFYRFDPVVRLIENKKSGGLVPVQGD